jgi:putative resolvase
MKSSQYARSVGVTNRTALQWWKDGQIKGYQVARAVKEIGSGLNDNRPQFLALLQDQSITTLVVEHIDRAPRFGFRYLQTFLMQEGAAA